MDDDRRRFWRVLLLIALVALAVRVTYVFVEKRDGALTGDELFYNAEANYLADGRLFTEPFNPASARRARGCSGPAPPPTTRRSPSASSRRSRSSATAASSRSA